MVEKGWLEKKKEGRTAILEIKPLKIWEETGRLKFFKDSSGNLPDNLREYLEKYLVYMIEHGADTTEKKENIEIYFENNLPSQHPEYEENYIYAIYDLNEALRDIRVSIEIVDSTIEDLETNLEPSTNVRTGSLEVLAKGYLNMLKGDEIGTPPGYEIDY
jgi:hypothetical protein